jgi:hypothetical protein
MVLKRDSDPKSYALINMLMDHEKKEEGRKVRDNQVLIALNKIFVVALANLSSFCQINLPLINAALMLQEVSLKMSKFSEVTGKIFRLS